MLNFKDFIEQKLPKNLVSKFHSTLNPKLWEGNDNTYTLKPEVSKKLKEITKEFIETLEVPKSSIKDVVITGSNANFNWTSHSDLDLHVLLNLPQASSSPIDIEDYVQDKKTLWNDRHNVTIYKIPVEAYATTKSEQLIQDAGTYSLQDSKWISLPAKKQLSVDSQQVKSKAESIADEIDTLIDTKANDENVIEDLQTRIARLRQSGLSSQGEFSVENLAFKVLRTSGYIDKLKRYAKTVQDAELSLN